MENNSKRPGLRPELSSENVVPPFDSNFHWDQYVPAFQDSSFLQPQPIPSSSSLPSYPTPGSTPETIHNSYNPYAHAKEEVVPVPSSVPAPVSKESFNYLIPLRRDLVWREPEIKYRSEKALREFLKQFEGYNTETFKEFHGELYVQSQGRHIEFAGWAFSAPAQFQYVFSNTVNIDSVWTIAAWYKKSTVYVAPYVDFWSILMPKAGSAMSPAANAHTPHLILVKKVMWNYEAKKRLTKEILERLVRAFPGQNKPKVAEFEGVLESEKSTWSGSGGPGHAKGRTYSGWKLLANREFEEYFLKATEKVTKKSDSSGEALWWEGILRSSDGVAGRWTISPWTEFWRLEKKNRSRRSSPMPSTPNVNSTMRFLIPIAPDLWRAPAGKKAARSLVQSIMETTLQPIDTEVTEFCAELAPKIAPNQLKLYRGLCVRGTTAFQIGYCSVMGMPLSEWWNAKAVTGSDLIVAPAVAEASLPSAQKVILSRPWMGSPSPSLSPSPTRSMSTSSAETVIRVGLPSEEVDQEMQLAPPSASTFSMPVVGTPGPEKTPRFIPPSSSAPSPFVAEGNINPAEWGAPFQYVLPTTTSSGMFPSSFATAPGSANNLREE